MCKKETKTIVIGDIHGCYSELVRLIDRLQEQRVYNMERDKLVFLGDYIDRGEDSRLVVQYIRQLQAHNENVIALKGNHEDMLVAYRNGENQSWLYNGAECTKRSYAGHDTLFADDIGWMEKLPLYYEDEHFIYVHAGVDVDRPMEEQSSQTLLWIREDFIFNDKPYRKKVIFGHTPSLFVYNTMQPYSHNGNTCIDTGCVYHGCLTALCIEGGEIKEYYQEKAA